LIRQCSVRSSYLRPAWIVLGTLALAGCAGQGPGQIFGAAAPTPLGGTSALPGAGPAIGKSAGNVALLVPLTGPLAPVGQSLENAAKLVFPAGSSPELDVRDTGGTPQGAAAAAQAAIAAGDGIILGPLTSPEAHAVAPIAQAAGVNVLSFTNDSTVAAPGIWPMGISPRQQVERVMQVAAGKGRTQVAALLPDSDFGRQLSNDISDESARLSEPSPQIVFYDDDFNSVNRAVEQISDFSGRGQMIESEIRQARDLDTNAGREQARELEHQQIPPPSFNALFIGAIRGDTLAEFATFLPYYDVNQPQVQFLGPANWAPLAPAMAHQPVLLGAMYAAPDPASASAFDTKYQATYGAPPPSIADIAFDAAAIAKLAGSNGGYTSSVLTAPAGFTGTDGTLVLQPDGQVQRGLAVFGVASGAPITVEPAPTQLAQPTS
jgi:ABC-type branched-subunit amino acid transport system substrate-binding protein